MSNAYELLGISTNATSIELERAYAAQQRAYDPTRLVGMDVGLVSIAQRRRLELDAAYRLLRPALALPPHLSSEDERRRDRETIGALVVLMVIALSVVLLRTTAVPERTVAVTGPGAVAAAQGATPATDFTLNRLDGTPVSLSQYRGKVVLVNFWATWCPPCVREMPSLVRVYEHYRDKGFVILGVNTTYQDEREKVAQFVRDQKVSFPVLLDLTGESNAGYGSRLMPTSYLIDQQGRIVYTHVGQIDEVTLAERVRALLP